MDAGEDWSIEGDIGLSKRLNRNESLKNSITNLEMPLGDYEKTSIDSKATNMTSSQKELRNGSLQVQRNQSVDRIKNRRAVIRTLSGSWKKSDYDHGEGMTLRRHNSCGNVENPEIEDHTSSEVHPSYRRQSSLLCCPDALWKLRRKIGSHLSKEEPKGGSSSSDEQADAGHSHSRQAELQRRADEAQLLLREANKTIAALQGKLDVYEGLLYGKSKASEVLLKQLLESVQVRAQSEARWNSEFREQRQEAGRLQFQLLSFQGNLTDTQRAWLERINGVLKENSELQVTVQTQTRIIRKLSSDKTSLKRECEELCSLQDAQERVAYQRRESLRTSTGEGAAEQTLLELAILGSCCCRSKNQEPCPCAKSACRRQHQVGQLWQKVSELTEQKEEAERLIEIYRQSFEEQLSRNRIVAKKVALLERENELAMKSGRLRTLLLRKDSQSNVINSLVDLVCDRTDALLQQQVLTKLLSRRLTELEKINRSETRLDTM